MVDEFEKRFDADYIFDGTKDDVVQLWLTNQSRWYPDVLVATNSRGEMFCSVTDVICEDLHTMPLFCKSGSMRHVSCTSGETLHVCEAYRREEVNPLPCHTQAERDRKAIAVETHKADYCTIFRGQSEVIVYGGESDWIAQYTRVTNHADGWRRWFSSRDAAEAKAKEVAEQPYKGRFGVNEGVTEEPAKFA